MAVPGPADLPFRSGEASYQPHQASALSSRMLWEEFALQTVALCGGLWRALAGTTVRYHCGLLSQIDVGLGTRIDNYWDGSVVNRARVWPAKSQRNIVVPKQ